MAKRTGQSSGRRRKTMKKKGGINWKKGVIGALALGGPAKAVNYVSPQMGSMGTQFGSTVERVGDSVYMGKHTSLDDTTSRALTSYGSNFDNNHFDYTTDTSYEPVVEFPQLITKFNESSKNAMFKNLEKFKKKNGRPPKITFVCAGNTCRSALAETVVANEFGDNIEVNSAGVNIRDDSGSPMKPQSQVMACGFRTCNMKHKSKHLTNKIIEKSDVVVFMTPKLMESAKNKLNLSTTPTNWEALNIPDPWKPSKGISQQDVYRMETTDGRSGAIVPASKQQSDYVEMAKSLITQVIPVINNLTGGRKLHKKTRRKRKRKRRKRKKTRKKTRKKK